MTLVAVVVVLGYYFGKKYYLKPGIEQGAVASDFHAIQYSCFLDNGSVSGDSGGGLWIGSAGGQHCNGEQAGAEQQVVAHRIVEQGLAGQAALHGGSPVVDRQFNAADPEVGLQAEALPHSALGTVVTETAVLRNSAIKKPRRSGAFSFA